MQILIPDDPPPLDSAPQLELEEEPEADAEVHQPLQEVHQDSAPLAAVSPLPPPLPPDGDGPPPPPLLTDDEVAPDGTLSAASSPLPEGIPPQLTNSDDGV